MQRYILITIVLFCFVPKYLCGQIWQHTYGAPGTPEIAVGIVKHYDEGYTIGINGNGANILKADINGNILWTKKYKYINNNYIGVRDISTYIDGTVYLGGGVFEGNNVYSFLIKTDECGKYKWCKKITYNTENGIIFVKTMADGNVLLGLAGVSSNPLIDRYQLCEIGPDGHIIWMRQVLPGTQTFFFNTEFFQMCLTSDGGSLMAGYTYYPYDTINYNWDAVLQPCLVKCDSLGEMQWVYPPLSGADTNRIGFFRGCTQIGDYYYAVGSDYGNEDTTLLPTIVRFDNSGLIQSYHIMLPDTMNDQLTNIISATDSSLLLLSATSVNWDDPNHLVVYSTDTLGNYHNAFFRYDLILGSFGDNIIRMKDNKFLITCKTPLGYINSQTDIVAIKLNANLEYDSIYTQPFTYDSLCPYPIVSDTVVCNCEPFVSVNEAKQVSETLKLYPNPAQDHVTVELGAGITATSIITVCDIYGREVYKAEVPPGMVQAGIHCGLWLPGIYMLTCYTGMHLKTAKLIKP